MYRSSPRIELLGGRNICMQLGSVEFRSTFIKPNRNRETFKSDKASQTMATSSEDTLDT